MWPGRPASCTVVCGPGSSTRIICNWGPRHGPQTPNARTRPGVAVSRLGIAPAGSWDHRPEASRRHARRDVVELAALDATKAHAIAGLEQDRLCGVRIVETHGRASEQPEPAGTLDRIDAALDATDGHAAGGHLDPRRVQPRDRQPLRRARHVRQAGREAD